MLMLNISSCCNTSLLSYMIRPVTFNVWMKPKRERQWRDSLQSKMHYCSTPSELHIRLECGEPESRLNNMHLLQKVGAGHLMMTANGFPCGTFYLWSPRPVADWSNVGARCACKKASWRCTELCSCHCEK